MKKKIKIFLTNVSKKSVLFRKIFRRILDLFRLIRYKFRTIGIRIDDKTIIFSGFNGKAFVDSPKALYQYMIQDSKYKNYKFIWAFKKEKLDENRFLEDNKNTKVILVNSKEFDRALAKAKYWIFNYKIGEHIYPKKNQVFLQCWHGTPLKRLGCDLIHFDNTLNTLEGMKKRYRIEAKKFSYFISPSKYATEKFISAWDLKSINKESIIIEEGYPRNDFLYNYTKEDVEKVKEILGIQGVNKKILLYAPTYRSNQHETGVGYTYKEEVNFERFQKELSDEFIILFRPHYFVASVFDFKKYEGFVYDVSNYDDINDLYIISDILITDYSSVFFDYANLKRPMIFHMYDLEHYRDESNGFYFDVEDVLPGKITRTDDDLISEIKRISKEFRYDEKYKKFNKTFNYLDDGQASKRVLEKVIR